MTAAIISKSPSADASPPFISAYPTTIPAPVNENNQNSGRGRSPPRSTANPAVHSGSSPTKTMECAEVTCCRASAVSSGKPITTPNAVTANDHRSPRSGRGWRSTSKKSAPNRAAIVALAQVRNVGSKAVTATRVAGSEPAKMATPIKPLIHPLVDFSIAQSSISLGSVHH